MARRYSRAPDPGFSRRKLRVSCVRTPNRWRLQPLHCCEPRPAANVINSLVTCRLDNPRAWEFRNAAGLPLLDSDCEGFLRRFFGEIEIADYPNESGDDPAPIRAINSVNRIVYIYS